MREFTDSKGVEWRVWAVTPAHMHPVTRGEDYLDKLGDGWLAFESASEKRRLETPYPTDWQTAPLTKIEELCRRASPAPKRRGNTPTGQRPAISATEAHAGADARQHFMSPGGREWTVGVHQSSDSDGAARTVLRFTAGDIVIELLKWPEHWRDLSVIEYAVLMLDAEPPSRFASGNEPQRRAEYTQE